MKIAQLYLATLRLLGLALGLACSLVPGIADPWPISLSSAYSWSGEQQGSFVEAICQASDGSIWVATEDNGLWRIFPRGAGKWTQVDESSVLGSDQIYALAEDAKGRIWAGHASSGLSVFNGVSWRGYGVVTGPLGGRVFAMAISPKDGDVWAATDCGLARYSMNGDRWRYYTQADGLPSNHPSALAFDGSGNIYVGTQCDGMALASAADGFAHWRTIAGADAMPATQTGDGVPSNEINALLVAANGDVFAGTPCGLARSADSGKTWRYIRGADWSARVSGQAVKVAPVPADPSTPILAEDDVTALAQDNGGTIWVGHLHKGVDALDPSTLALLGTSNKSAGDITSLVPIRGGRLLIGSYGGGLLMAPQRGRPTADSGGADGEDGGDQFPSPAAPPSDTQINDLRNRLAALPESSSTGAFAAYLGSDWQTRGDWLGRYGRQGAVLCGVVSPFDAAFGYPTTFHYSAGTGPHNAAGMDSAGRTIYISKLRDDDPRVPFDPRIGYRRPAEWNDGSYDITRYPPQWEGPDLWLTVTVDSGLHRLSLYHFNYDGEDDGESNNRFRDHLILVYSGDYKTAVAGESPLARARVSSFYAGVYSQFVVNGPGTYTVKVERDGSFCTKIAAIFVDPIEASSVLCGGAVGSDALKQEFGDTSYDPPTYATDGLGAKLLADSIALWTAAQTAVGQSGGAAYYRVATTMAYRAAIAAGGSNAMLENWRWTMRLWLPSDRAKYRGAVAAIKPLTVDRGVYGDPFDPKSGQ